MLAMLVIGLALVMDLVDVTIVNVGIPAIHDGLQTSAAAIQWIVAGYTLVFAVGLIAGGRLGDVYGYRRLFLLGVTGFTLASAACGLASTASMLVAARALQGAAAALMLPQVMALVQVMYAPAQRTRVIAVFGVLGGMAAALGPIIGGLLLAANWLNLGWRVVFMINLPIGLFSFVASLCLLPAGRGVGATGLAPFDIGGTLLTIVTLTCLVFPLIEGTDLQWPACMIVMLVLSLPLALLTWTTLASRQRRGAATLINPDVLRLKSVRFGLLCSLCLNGIVVAHLLMLTLVLQIGLHYTPLQMSLLCLPIALGAMLSISLTGPFLMPRIGHRTVTLGAGVLLASVIAMGAVLNANPVPLIALLSAQLGIGLGLGLIGPPLSVLTLQEVPLSDAGSMSGMLTAVQELAGAFAIAASGLLFFAALAHAPNVLNAPHESNAYAQAYLKALPLMGGLIIAGLVLSLLIAPLAPLHRCTAVPLAIDPELDKVS
jgi:EmrB/QacA subfamily drug resistance transporter